MAKKEYPKDRPKRETGRPQAIIDWDLVDNLLIAGCSGLEIAGHIGLHHSTLYDRCLTDKKLSFTEYSSKKYAKGDSLLRAAQFAKALGKTDKGDNTLLIWLGKTRLKQVEEKKEENKNTEIVFKVNYDNANNNLQVSPETLPAPDPASSE